MYRFMKNTGSIPVILPLCVLMISLLPACQPAPRAPSPPAATPPAAAQPAPIVTPATAMKWVADGVISADEYAQTKTYGDLSISWSNDSDYIYIGLKAKTAGWVAVGFGPVTFMKNADIIMGSVKDGALTIADTFSTGEFGPHPPDTQLGGTDDILASAGKTANGYTVVEFKWKLDTGDKSDKPLVKGINKIIWAYANEPVLTIKHSSRGPGEIELK